MAVALWLVGSHSQNETVDFESGTNFVQKGKPTLKANSTPTSLALCPKVSEMTSSWPASAKAGSEVSRLKTGFSETGIKMFMPIPNTRCVRVNSILERIRVDPVINLDSTV